MRSSPFLRLNCGAGTVEILPRIRKKLMQNSQIPRRGGGRRRQRFETHNLTSLFLSAMQSLIHCSRRRCTENQSESSLGMRPRRAEARDEVNRRWKGETERDMPRQRELRSGRESQIEKQSESSSGMRHCQSASERGSQASMQGGDVRLVGRRLYLLSKVIINSYQ